MPIKHFHRMLWTLALMASLGLGRDLAAQHVDIMVQHSSGQLVTGVANVFDNAFTIPSQIFTRNLFSNYRSADPGFFSLSEGNPLLPAEALPTDSDLYWDYLPMTVDQTVSNLFYWDGLDSNQNGLNLDDVEFVRPTNAVFKVINNGTFTADSSDHLVPGGLVDTTAFDGSIHKHPAYRVETLDATNPLEGIYLVSQQVRLQGLETSDPYFLVFRTSTLSNDALAMAADWIEANIEMLTSPPLLAGDYNSDGLVNIADYTFWRDTLGSTTNLSANGDDSGPSQGVIDAADYVVWKGEFGSSLSQTSGAFGASQPVPEPSAGLLVMGLLAALFAYGRTGDSRTC